jgi:uncharacterized protein YprB with RNaseH-like and TPR domain
MITRSKVRSFLLKKKGYIKKSPLKVAKAIWRTQSHTFPKTHDDVNKELHLIRGVQSTLRAAENYLASTKELDILDIYNKIQDAKDRPKRRMFFDIEVSPNLVLSWGIGRNLTLDHNSIVQERAIICISYKWEGDDKVYALRWNNGDDQEMLRKFTKIIDSADEVIAQNGDNFDIKWLRTRCIYHRIPISSKFNSIDTLKMARAGFRFNCNKLDYIGQFFGLGSKIKTDFKLWKDILLYNNKEALDFMIEYCKKDVVLLEKIYNQLQEFSPVKKFKYKI